MTKLMKKALEAMREWPQDRQDEAAALLLALDRLGTSYHATQDELRAIDEALDQVERGERATPAQVEDAFARFRK
jgi:predicted nuclease with TOPRIM domain